MLIRFEGNDIVMRMCGDGELIFYGIVVWWSQIFFCCGQESESLT